MPPFLTLLVPKGSPQPTLFSFIVTCVTEHRYHRVRSTMWPVESVLTGHFWTPLPRLTALEHSLHLSRGILKWGCYGCILFLLISLAHICKDRIRHIAWVTFHSFYIKKECVSCVVQVTACPAIVPIRGDHAAAALPWPSNTRCYSLLQLFQAREILPS